MKNKFCRYWNSEYHKCWSDNVLPLVLSYPYKLSQHLFNYESVTSREVLPVKHKRHVFFFNNFY